MESTGKPQSRDESIISASLLLLLLLIVIVILAMQQHVDMARFGLDGSGPSDASQQVSEEDAAPGIPSTLASLAPAGFGPLSNAELYLPGTLYEKINGKAPFYLEAGFVGLWTQRYVSRANADLWMELSAYDMGAPKNAFSVYSVQRRWEASSLPGLDPVFGYRTGNALYFAAGPYYVELVGSAESDELFDAMAGIPDKLRVMLAIDRSPGISGLDLLPAEGMVQGSLTLYLTNVFGFEGLSDTFVARYAAHDEVEVSAFVSRRPDQEDAASAFESYCASMIDSGGTVMETRDGDVRYKMIDFYGAIEIVFATGSFVGGIHEAVDEASARKLAARLMDRFRAEPK